MKSASEVIARDGFRLSTPRYRDALEFLLAIARQAANCLRRTEHRQVRASTESPGRSLPVASSAVPNRANMLHDACSQMMGISAPCLRR